MIIPRVFLPPEGVDTNQSNELDHSLVSRCCLLGNIVISASEASILSTNSQLQCLSKEFFGKICFDGFSVSDEEIIMSYLDVGLRIGFFRLSESDEMSLISSLKTFPRERVGISTSFVENISSSMSLISNVILSYRECVENFLIRSMSFAYQSFWS